MITVDELAGMLKLSRSKIYDLKEKSGYMKVGGSVRFARAAEAARKLLDLGVNEWVVIHCPEGALAVGKRGEMEMRGSVRVPAERIAGTVGAGDAFAAGMLFGLHEGREMPECLRMAVCAAAASLSAAAATAGVKPMDECLETGNSLGFRALRTNRGKKEMTAVHF